MKEQLEDLVRKATWGDEVLGITIYKPPTETRSEYPMTEMGIETKKRHRAYNRAYEERWITPALLLQGGSGCCNKCHLVWCGS